MAKHRRSFLYRHSLSMVAVGLLIVWIVGYRMLDPKTHLGAFFGNAVADWSGSVVIILGTKFLYEVGSTESRPVKGKERSAWLAVWRSPRRPQDCSHRRVPAISFWPGSGRSLTAVLAPRGREVANISGGFL